MLTDYDLVGGPQYYVLNLERRGPKATPSGQKLWLTKCMMASDRQITNRFRQPEDVHRLLLSA
jgi:hypothetical protein